MAYLYTNAKGFKVNRHSHSAGMDWQFCPRFYDLKRRQGWSEREQRASMFIGKCVETAIQAYCEGRGDIFKVFDCEWGKLNPNFDAICPHAGAPCEICKQVAARNKKITYSAVEKGWDRVLKMGRDMLRLFVALLPSLPIVKPRFQRELNPEVFPNTKFAGITFTSYLDAICSPPSDHPMLPVLNPPSDRPFRPLIVDFKVKGKRYPTDRRMVIQNLQMKKYSWSSGIRDVALLAFVKASPEIKRGSKVQLLDKCGGFPAGSEMLAVEPEEVEFEVKVSNALEDAVIGKKPRKPIFEKRGTGNWFVIPATEEVEKAFELAIGETDGKEAKAIRLAFVSEHGVPVSREQLTTQGFQFLAARMPDEKAADAGRLIAQEIVEIENAERTGEFPELGGIDYPNDKCVNCCMRGICISDDRLRDELLVKAGEEWLDETEMAEV